MYLKRLELLGFKSFAQKTTLEFPAGVTAVVGPNGSGKSNIIDAIRWILGEREAKNIRAEKSENLIFSGTPQRTRAGFAQVAITFDNSSKFFPVDFSEVTIRRRVTRDGTSQYFLNDSEVRLRDVIDFFAKAKLGTKGLTIINQGNSDLFIAASPSERRVMMEEVLGLRQYQIKRHEAENKLDQTGVNLDKVQALIEELLPHLRLLRRQATKWEKHASVAESLRDLENQYFTFRLAECKKELARIEPEVKKIEVSIHEKEIELSKRQNDLALLEKKQPQGDAHFFEFKKKQTDLLNRRSQIQKDLGRFEAELEFLLARPKASVKEVELLAVIKDVKRVITEALQVNDVRLIKQALKELDQKIADVLDGGSKEVASRQKEIEKTKTTLAGELESLEQGLADLTGFESKLATEMREFNVQFKQVFALVEAKKNEVSALEHQRDRLAFDKERVELRLKDLASLANQANRKLEEFEALPAPAQFDAASVEHTMLKLRGELASIGEIDQAMLKDAKDMEARYTFLSGQLADLKKATEDLRVLIHELTEKIHNEFTNALHSVNEEFNKYFRLMFNGGRAKLHLIKKPAVAKALVGEEKENNAPEGILEEMEEAKEEFDEGGLDVELSIPRKNIRGLDLLSGGERSLVSIAVLFALISVSPPPFLVLDEVDAALDENNTKRFASLIENFSPKSQFLLVTHNRATMGAANILYGVTMREDGTSRMLSLKLDEVPAEMVSAA